MGLSVTLSFEHKSDSKRKTGNYVVVSLIYYIKQFPANCSNALMTLYRQKSSLSPRFFSWGMGEREKLFIVK